MTQADTKEIRTIFKDYMIKEWELPITSYPYRKLSV
jgi:hypothetical protein